MSDILGPFQPVVLLLTGGGVLLAAARTWAHWQKEDNAKENAAALVIALETERTKTKAMINESLSNERARMLAEIGAEIASERDETRRMIEAAIQAHAREEASKFEGLYTRLTEMTVKVEIAVQDAKRVALHVSAEYQDLRKRIEELQREVEHLRSEVRALTDKTK